MRNKRTMRHSCNYTASKSTLARHFQEYSTYTHLAGIAMFAACLLMALGCAVFGW